MDNPPHRPPEEPFRLRDATACLKLIEVQDRVLADFLPQMVWIVRESDRHLLYANTSFRAYFGASEQTWEKREAYFHPDDLPIVHNAFEVVKRQGRTPDEEVRLRGKDGHYRWHKITLVPVTYDGAIAEWVVTALDVDEMVLARKTLQEATDLFSLSQEAAGAGSWDLDLQTSAVRLSRESARLHGIADHTVEMDLEGWRQVVNPVDAKTVLEALQIAVDSRTTFNGEFRIRGTGPGVRWLSGIGRAYYDPSGVPVRMIGLNFDITERKTTEARLMEAAEAAEKARQAAEVASSAKSDFLATMSHEIRTPLHSIIGYTDYLLDESDIAPKHRRPLELIQESSAALLTVVNDILDFSKIEAGQIELDPIVFSPRSLVDNVASMLSAIAERKGLVIRANVVDDVPLNLKGDVNRLRQILINFVNNAVKFTQEGEIAVELSWQKDRAGSGTLRAAVSDTGIGIPEDRIERLFLRFSQSDTSITRRYGGTGLGLAICKALVEAMGGRIGVESREGVGSVFWVEVPLSIAEETKSEKQEHRTEQSSMLGSLSILLVEDVEVNQDLGRLVLESLSHRIDVAENGAEAVRMTRETAYDLVFMDVQMPVMDGLTAIRLIRAADHPGRSTPIVAMTANILPQQVAVIREAGADDHVGKPFRQAELTAAIDRWARRPSNHIREDGGQEVAESARFDQESFDALKAMVSKEALSKIVTKFLIDLDARFGDVSADRDRHRLTGDAHAIIGSAGLLGFNALTSICRTLEGGPHDVAVLEPLVSRLRAECQRVREDLTRLV